MVNNNEYNLMNTQEIKDRLDQNHAIEAEEIRQLCSELDRSEQVITELLRTIRYLSDKVIEA
jgi:hypothetical protein